MRASSAPRSSLPPLEPEASDEPKQPEPEPQPEPQPAQQPQSEPQPHEEPPPAGEEQEVAASYSWDEIVNAPTDGSDIMVRYEGETEGRLVRWKHGRYFTGRKWAPGGRWVPVDSLQPLPAAHPTHWARPAGYGVAEQPAIEVTAEGVGYETPPEVEAA